MSPCKLQIMLGWGCFFSPPIDGKHWHMMNLPDYGLLGEHDGASEKFSNQVAIETPKHGWNG
jgi:hypothetical protein